MPALFGADAEVKLEISADAPARIPDDVVGTVTGKGSTPKFDQHGFESS